MATESRILVLEEKEEKGLNARMGYKIGNLTL